MASTGEADRKRRHVSSLSPTAVAKNQSLSHVSEDKKIDTKVLQFRNQKLSQKLEVQKMEISALEKKLSQHQEKQQSHEKVLMAVSNCWEKLAHDLETRSVSIKSMVHSGENIDNSAMDNDCASSSFGDVFLKRLAETNSSESCFPSSSFDEMIEDGDKACEKSRNILHNIVSAVDDLWRMKDGLYTAVLTAIPDDGSCKRKAACDAAIEVKNLRSALSDLHWKHRSLARELRKHQKNDLKNKAELRRLQGELESTIRELEDSNTKIAALKAEKDATKGAFFPVLSMGNRHPVMDNSQDKQKDLHEMDLRLKESMAHSSSRLQELKRLLEERVEILKKLSSLQGTLKNVKSISSARAFKLVKVELEKSKADVIQCQALYEKLQVEKDKILWRERAAVVESDLSDVYRRSLNAAGFRIDELEIDIQKLNDEKEQIAAKLEQASREPGRKEIISNFREFVSSFPEDMGSMQSKLRKYKETAADVHSLRAEVQSVSNVLTRKARELVTLSGRSASQDDEIKRLQAMAQDLKESDMELKLIMEMYQREATLPRNFAEARDKEFRAWARVHSLKSSLDEHNMESRVKTAIEAEALSQRRLAAAEAEIADLREKYETAERSKSKLAGVLKSKHEENEAYLSEIETIGQAYDDMQNQNQQLLKQITERDDYNIKLELEALRGRQNHDLLAMENQALQKKIKQGNVSRGMFEMKAVRIEVQVKNCADQLHRLSEDRCQYKISLENTQRRVFEARNSSQQTRVSLDELQCKTKTSRENLSMLHVELEKERFAKKRLEEEYEAVKRKEESLRAQKEGSVVAKLQVELREYKEILKCSICHDRPKEVVITKCYHLLCNPCVQKVIDSRHRKCPICAASFGPNDVKPVYI